MSIGTPTKTSLIAGSVVVGFLATMLAFWSVGNARPAWGAFNFAIALVGLVTFVAVRARSDKT